MKSQVRIVLIIAISLAVPFFGVWQRWSEIRAFAHQLQGDTAPAPIPEPGRSHSPTRSYLTQTSPAAPVAPAAEAQPTDWQATMEKALVSSSEPAVTSRKLLEALPHLPETGKAEAVQHLTNLVGDDDYAPLSQMLANPETPEGLQDMLMADLLNRRNGVKLPALLEVARTPNHAKAMEAKAFLQPFLQTDLTDDWNKNQEKLTLWLKDHPDS